MGNLLLFSDLSLPRNLGTRLLVNFLAFCVSILYSLVGIVFEVVFMVANLDNIEMFKSMYQGMQDRFYVIIGIFMLFKVSMSMISYFANPDKLTDKEAGMGKVVTRMITVLILLIFVPTFVFPFLSNLQMPLLNTVGKVVLNTDGGLDYNGAHSKGQQMATVLLGGFFNIREDCGKESAELESNIIDAITNLADQECSGDKKSFKYNFDFVGALSAILPILIIAIIIGVQVSIRSFKLIILKLLAPIPIIYYMDPKSMKDGGKTSAYIKLFMTTYLDLFIHFGALFFVVELINKLSTAWFNADFLIDGVTLAAKTGVIGLVFVIIGLLLFAFQAPKFVKKALGLKDSEFGSGLAGLLTTGAAMAGAVGAGVAGFGASAKAGGSFIQNFGAAASSAISGARAGYKGAGDKGDVMAGLRAVNENQARLRANRAAGVTGLGTIKSGLMSVFTGETPADILESRIKNQQDFSKSIDAVTKRAESEMIKNTETKGSITKGGSDYVNYKSFTAAMNAAKSAGQTDFEYTNYTKRLDANGNVMMDANGNTLWNETTQRISMQDAEMNIGWIKKDNTKDYLDQVMSGTINDIVMDNLVDDANAKGRSISTISSLDGVTNADLTAAGYTNAIGKDFSVGDLNGLKKIKDYVDMATTNDTRANQKNVAEKNAFYGKSNK